MKKKLLFYLILLLGLNSLAQINVSTGVDVSGIALPIGSLDSWVITSSPNPPATPVLVSNHYSGYWQSTPILTTNAGWVNATGAACCANAPGIYTFEKSFNVPSGTSNLNCNFSVAYDDDIVSLELVKPDLTTIPLTVIPTTPYHLSLPITNVISSPLNGIWKIRAVINFIDEAAAFILSGSVSLNCQTLYVDADNDGYDNGSVVDCSGTVPLGYSLTTLGTDCDDTNASIGLSFVLPTGLQTGLLAQYTFNSGSTNDFSGNSRHLTNTSAISATDRNGNSNCAFEFDNLPSSNNQYLSTTNTAFLNGLTEYSISAWYKAKDPSRGIVDYEVLVGRDTSALNCPDRVGQWSLGLYDCRYAVFGRQNSVWENLSAPCNEIEVWHHLTATYNQATDIMKIYKDGVFQSSSFGVANCGIGVTVSSLDIGDLFLGKGFTGILDDVFIHNREITAAEVTQLYGLGSSCCATSPCTTLVTPLFNYVAPICSGDALSSLPTTSINSITGTWSPALNNLATTTYTFTPDAGQCATTTTMIIEVNPIRTPIFLLGFTYCAGELSGMPYSNISDNFPTGISGTWSPAFNNMVTGTYTFTPNPGQCATSTTITIPILPVNLNTSTITACSSYTWPLNGVTYTASGVYTDIIDCTTGLLYLTIETPTTWYIDADGDGAGNPLVSIVSCTQPAGYVSNNFDCDDTNALINPCAIENRTDGIDNNCNGFIDEIVTKLVASQCGANLTSINQLIVAQTPVVPSGSTICGYRFKVTKMIGGILSSIPADMQIITRPSTSFNLTLLASYAYNTTYSVQVSVCVNGVWQPYGGNCCTVRCNKLSKIQATQCGTTVATMNTLIYADYFNFVKPSSFVPTFVKPWRFEITQVTPGAGFGVVQTYDYQLINFTMNNFASITYNTTYSVRVAFLNVDGTWSSYGLPCTITTPSFPTTQIQTSQCGFTALNGTQLIWAIGVATSVASPTHYSFRLSNTSLPYSATIVNTNKNFYLNQFSGLLPSTTYNVEVSMEIGGIFGPYGSMCTITTPAVFKTASPIVEVSKNEFEVIGYPNPFIDDINLKIMSSSEEPTLISVYDMLGRIIETQTIQKDNINEIKLGSNYPTGVYNVIVLQGENNDMIRIIKK